MAAATFCGAAQVSAATLSTNRFRIVVDDQGTSRKEVLSIRTGETWTPALLASGAVHVTTGAGMQVCALTEARVIGRGLLLSGDCGDVGNFEQRVQLTGEEDLLKVSTRLILKKGVTISSVEDRYDFAPSRHAADNEHSGPLDFVWSQNMKSEAGDLIPTNCFKSPVVMFQQGRVFAALMPQLSNRHVEVRALDLDVTSGPRPWLAYGAIPSEPHGHSYFRRAAKATLPTIADSVEYEYDLVLSSQAPLLGYRRVVRLLWQRMGHPALLQSSGEQRNAVRPELGSFATWRQEAWASDADKIYRSFPCGTAVCGTLESQRNVTGDWDHPASDAWFNAWFETLRTAYGWYVYGRTSKDPEMMHRAESVLNLALSSPRKARAFSTIYLVDSKRWVPGDGWASYADSYHAFSMSWTAYWMLRWAEDLEPARKKEILEFVGSYGDFLLAHQKKSGVIPSWYEAESLHPRPDLRDFNAESAPSALFLATLGRATGEARYVSAAERAMAFVMREVVPRQRWFDFETFLSCSPKDYSSYDHWTAQYPRNNLAEMQAPQAMLELYQITHKAEYLEQGAELLDYLLLTQQVWNNPSFTPLLLGGFTTQNSDAEWSDARQGYAATLLLDYYQATGNFEYLERAVAAARSTFAVAPWENWAHTGYIDQPGALTGFHWGTGSAMTSVEILQPSLGDGLVDLSTARGLGFDECSITGVFANGDAVSFSIDSPSRDRLFHVVFRGVDRSRIYRVRWNNKEETSVTGEELLTKGLMVGPLNHAS